MENTLSTADFLALENRGFGYRDGYCHRGHSAASTTGIGLAAGLGGGALLLAIAGIWGVNKASEARNAGAIQSIAGLAGAVGSINNNINMQRTAMESRMSEERLSRETWQHQQMPTVQSYIDVQANPNQSASALALASALAQNNNGLNAAIGTDSFLKVQRYSAPQPCGCDTCCGN